MKLQEEYESLIEKRSRYLVRAQEFARLTIPSLMQRTEFPSKEDDYSNQLTFQSAGAQAVNHLTNKMALTLFPPQKSFFRAEVTDKQKKLLATKGIKGADLKEQLSTVERNSITTMDRISARPAVTELLSLLMVTGNSLLTQNSFDKMQAIPMNRYVMDRDMDGTVTKIVLMEKKFLINFPEDLKEEATRIFKSENIGDGEGADFYTGAIKGSDGKFKVSQSINDVQIGKESNVKEENLPWRPQTWKLKYGEVWGRSLVEEHYGDFASLEVLAKAENKGMILLSEIKFLVDPGSILDLDHFSKAETGSYHIGSKDDVTVIQFSNELNYEVLQATIQKYERRIGQVFMLNSANRRDAERVTAVELRLDAVELETSLGGIYGKFAQELQKPMARSLLKTMGAGSILDDLELIIITGLDALGRTGDLDKIAQFNEMMLVPDKWPEQIKSRVKWDDYTKTVSAALSMETTWLMNEKEHKAKLAQDAKAQQDNVIQEGMGKAIPQVANNMSQGQDGG